MKILENGVRISKKRKGRKKTGIKQQINRNYGKIPEICRGQKEQAEEKKS